MYTKDDRCVHCGSVYLCEFTSTNKKLCHDCKRYQDWKLRAGQDPLFDGMKPPKE